MKTKPIAMAAALAAAAAGGVVVGQGRGPNDMGLRDQVQVQIATPVPSVTPAIVGYVTYDLYGPDGALKQRVEGPNLIVDGGKDAAIRQVMAATQPSPFVYVAIGMSSAVPAAGQTACPGEPANGSTPAATPGVAYSRVSGSQDFSTGTGIGKLSATFEAGKATGRIRETCLMNASSGGLMLARKGGNTIDITKEAADALVVTWTVSEQ